MANTTSPNMGLTIPGIGTEASPTWASDLNASLSVIDSHNHSSGQGVQITPSGLNINSDLAFQSNNATQLRSARFTAQTAVLSGASDVGCLYVVNNELYYNDVTGGHNVQITSNGTVNATSSGISSGTASAAFAGGVLAVKASSTSGANVLMQSAVLTNSNNLTNQLTLQAPTLSSSITETLPAIPASKSFMAIDSSGAMSGYAPIAQGIQRSNLSAVGQQISSSSGSFSTSSATYVAVTNLSVTITTSGRPVMLILQSDGTSLNGGGYFQTSSGSSAGITILRGASNIYYSAFGGLSGAISTLVSSSIQMLDTPSAGTQTYSVQVLSSSGPLFVYQTVLVAYEL